MMTFNTDPTTQTDREALCMNLAYLVKEDIQIANAVILEYVSLLNNSRLDDMLDWTTKEIKSDV